MLSVGDFVQRERSPDSEKAGDTDVATYGWKSERVKRTNNKKQKTV